MGFDWLHRYNHHRFHTASKGEPPISRVNNLAQEIPASRDESCGVRRSYCRTVTEEGF
jgi:hypothetical protein